MKIDVYCDEAYPDLFSSQRPQARYMIIGSLWLRAEDRALYKDAIHRLRDQYKIGGEFKWQKISPSRIQFYKALIDAKRGHTYFLIVNRPKGLPEHRVRRTDWSWKTMTCEKLPEGAYDVRYNPEKAQTACEATKEAGLPKISF